MSLLNRPQSNTSVSEGGTQTRRIPALDGWRGTAIILVLFDHIQHAMLHRYAEPWTQTGQHGVTIFFVLSGFLITSKLIEGPINLSQFYLRRFFRLMPVAWIFLAAMVLFDRLVHTHFISVSEILGCVFFYRNYLGVAGGGVAGHFWSLSLEEQFYLVWPALLLLAGIRRCRWIALIGAIACALYREVFWSYYDHNLLNNQTEVRADALLVGCLLAMILIKYETAVGLSATLVRWSKLLVIPAAAVLLFCIASFHWLPPLTECIAIAFLLGITVLYPDTFLTRLLSFRPLGWLGAVSYSVYVWQSFFMLPWNNAVRPLLLCVGLPVLALSSYYWIELPAARFGRRFAQRFKRGLPVDRSTPALAQHPLLEGD